MVKHIILWKLKEEHNNDVVKNGIKQGLEGLMGKIPGLVEIRVETQPLSSSNTQVMLYSVFQDEQALEGYAKHPAHNKIADSMVRPYTESRACFDYIVD